MGRWYLDYLTQWLNKNKTIAKTQQPLRTDLAKSVFFSQILTFVVTLIFCPGINAETWRGGFKHLFVLAMFMHSLHTFYLKAAHSYNCLLQKLAKLKARHQFKWKYWLHVPEKENHVVKTARLDQT
jgi:hypothetical protein